VDPATVCVPAGHEPGGWNVQVPAALHAACVFGEAAWHTAVSATSEVSVASQNASSWSQGVAGLESLSWYPGGQWMQDVAACAEYSPAPHRTHTVAGSESSSFVPRGQAVHDVLPAGL